MRRIKKSARAYRDAPIPRLARQSKRRTVKHDSTVLVDTNVILEAHLVRAWRALTGGYRVETVEECVAETQTGFQRRQPEQQIDVRELRASLEAVHSVGNRELAELKIKAHDIALDRGEESLWAHALGRGDNWILCGPDKASLRCGVRLGCRDRLVSMEGLLDEVGHRPGTALREAYTRRWHERTLGGLVLAER